MRHPRDSPSRRQRKEALRLARSVPDIGNLSRRPVGGNGQMFGESLTSTSVLRFHKARLSRGIRDSN
jgi:hypothetical protein